MDKNISSPAGRRTDPSQAALPNQHHAIQYSSKFHSDDSKPVPLAHFMGARRDLNGPVLTKQRVDEKEIRPDGWELAEKRFQQAQSAGGINSLASLLFSGNHSSGTSNLSSHAANFTKRPLPGMVPQDRLNGHPKERTNSLDHPPTQPSLFTKNQNNKPKTTTTSSSSHQTTPTSHAASYLKPKSLADRLAQLGVSSDLQSIKTTNITTASPRAEKSPTDKIPQQPELQPNPQPDSTRNIRRIPKSHSAIFTAPQTSLQDKPDRKEKIPLSTHVVPPRGIPNPNPQSRVSPTPSSPLPNIPLIATPNPPSQPGSGPSYKRNARPQSAFPHAPHISTEGSATLGVPNKALTASLSRLAGSNIVAQRLEWSKQKEQLGTMDEFGSPLLKTSPGSTPSALHPQIPSPALPSPSLPPNQNVVFLERPKNINEPSTDIVSGGSSQSRQQSLPRQHTGPKLTEPVLEKKHLNQFKKSTRSDEDDDQRFSIANNRDNKRNKKSIENVALGRFTKATEDAHPSLTSPLRLSHKSRARLPRRPSGSTPANRPCVNTSQVGSSPAHIVSRQLPSIPTFSPLMKKGTSELAAVWGTQLSHPAKKTAEGDCHHLKKPSQPASSPLSSHRPLPTPPPPAALPARPKTATAADNSRPLPVPPSPTVAAVPLSPEPRVRTRPLPIPQIKPEPSHPQPPQIYPRHPPIDVSMIWASYEEKRRSLSALGEPGSLAQLEVFQLNRNQMDEFSTTMLDADDYGIFFSQETLLIICTMKGSQMVLMIWKGRDVEEDDEGETGARIERLLKKYGIERQSKVVKVSQGYEPPELVQALGGRLLLRTGDRFDSVYQRGLSAAFTCKSFPLLGSERRSGGPDERVIVIEEEVFDPANAVTLCTGYSTLLKQLRNEAGPLKASYSLSLFLWPNFHIHPPFFFTEFEEVDEGNESDEFLSLFCNAAFARSYHWKYKELVPMGALILDSDGRMQERVGGSGVSVVWTGLEVYVLVAREATQERTDVHKGLALARSLARVHPAHPTLSVKRKLAVHALIFPTLIPVDLLASIRFAFDLHRFNNGTHSPAAMNLVSLDEAHQDPSDSWLST
ncbi:uncharacterized protein VP01_1521g1 [Puccinia sorghi]|uniref:Gelsolin-like domain-containing protein n=1 Tax=Puccinia sorghi TaxID=27349 RepID=A0A0L6VIY3_9BASI|nr:uncharacterized protein VP01_1521g1 [Puccinia sorghi]